MRMKVIVKINKETSKKDTVSQASLTSQHHICKFLKLIIQMFESLDNQTER